MKILKQCFQMPRSLLIRKCMIIVTFISIMIKVLLCFILAVFLKKRYVVAEEEDEDTDDATRRLDE